MSLTINAPTITPHEFEQVLTDNWSTPAVWEDKTGSKPVAVWGDPGIGKTTIIEGLCGRLGRGYVNRRPVNETASDSKGIPFPDMEKMMTVWLRDNLLPSEPGTVLVLDEFAAAIGIVQSTYNQLAESGRIAGYELPPGCHIVVLGNLPSSKAGSSRLGSQSYNRFENYVLKASAPNLVDYALANGWHPALTHFIRANPDVVEGFDPVQMVNSTPRALEGVGRMIDAGMNDIRWKRVEALIGSGHIEKLRVSMALWNEVPDLSAVLEGEMVPPPVAPDVQYMSAAQLGRFVTKQSFGHALAWLKPQSMELVEVMVSIATTKVPEICETEAYLGYVNSRAVW